MRSAFPARLFFCFDMRSHRLGMPGLKVSAVFVTNELRNDLFRCGGAFLAKICLHHISFKPNRRLDMITPLVQPLAAMVTIILAFVHFFSSCRALRLSSVSTQRKSAPYPSTLPMSNTSPIICSVVILFPCLFSQRLDFSTVLHIIKVKELPVAVAVCTR